MRLHDFHDNPGQVIVTELVVRRGDYCCISTVVHEHGGYETAIWDGPWHGKSSRSYDEPASRVMHQLWVAALQRCLCARPIDHIPIQATIREGKNK